MARLNPFRGLENPKGVWAWGMYDLANQSFQLLINTLLFSIYVEQVVVVGDPQAGARLWSKMSSASLILVVILSPFMGALADHRALKRELLLGTGIVCAALTCALALVAPGQEWMALALYIPAAVACGLGENFLGSFLPEISTPRNVGYVSALGWTMSYVGALALLAIVATVTFVLGRDRPEQFPPIFVFAGIWFGAGMIPALIFLRERAKPVPTDRGAISSVIRRLVASAREAGQHRDLARFYMAFFVYSLGTLAVIYFLGIVGRSMGFGLGELMLMALVIAMTAGGAAAVTARLQDRVGHRRTISAFLGAWIVACALIAVAQVGGAPAWAFWPLAGVVGVALGGIGTSSRAMVGAFTPEARAGEFFGLWGMIYKLAGAVGVLAYGYVSTLPADRAVGQAIGMGMLSLFFAVGLALLWRVDEKRGMAGAHGELHSLP